jgi:isoquinoline 1-oxidoreductase beta subunit
MRRRTFLLGAGAAVGGLVIGYSAWSASFERQAEELLAGDPGHLFGGWIKIAPDDTVTVYVPHVDMGQGTHTALAMLAAEELDADWATVRTRRAPGEKPFANRFLARGWIIDDQTYPLVDGLVNTVFVEAARQMNLQITGGSTAVRFTGRFGMRLAGATARALMVEAAARRWNVPASQIEVSEGIVSHAGSGRSARFGELAEAASRLRPPSARPVFKDPSNWRIAGTSPLRHDIPPKTDGSFSYGIDLTLPDMLHAAVSSAPVHGGRLVSVDTAPARSAAGVFEIVTTERAVAVIATSWWEARSALDLLAPNFSDDRPAIHHRDSLWAAQDSALSASEADKLVSLGDAGEAIQASPPDRIVAARYRVPWLHHAAMEPVNVTAQLADGRLTVWGGEQDALLAKAQMMDLSGLGADAVTFHGLAAGGAFGRRVSPSADYMEHVVPLARAASPRPVKLILHREEEFTQGAYRPALATDISASLGEDGLPTAWSQTFLAGPTRNEGYALPYAIPNQSLRAVSFASHVRTGTWRAVAHTQHAFWTESFIDELAHAAGHDPYDYRRRLLPEGSRWQRVLDAVAQDAEWAEPSAPGIGKGIAIAESYGTIAAHVVEIALDAAGRPSVTRVVAAVDCGTVIHPDTALQQVEGAIIMGLSAAMREEITLSDGVVVEQSFRDYPIFTMADTPAIQIRFLESDGAWGGLGEPGLPPAAPALANAVFAATGRRIRDLPILRAFDGAA